jgi:hypothetical protein
MLSRRYQLLGDIPLNRVSPFTSYAVGAMHVAA